MRTLLLAVIGVLALFVAMFFAAAETALNRIDPVRVSALDQQHRRGASMLHRLVGDPERYAVTLNGVLLLEFAAQIAWITLIGEMLLVSVDGPWFFLGLLLEVLCGYLLTVAFPKTLSFHKSERIALLSAPLIAFLTRVIPLKFITRPLIGLANALVPGGTGSSGPFAYEQQILAITAHAEANDEIEDDERELIHSVIEFRNTIVRETMVPRTDMISVGEDRLVGEALDLALAKGLSRMPVYKDETDHITGVVFTKDLMRACREGKTDEVHVAALRKEAKYVPETKRVAELLREMQTEHRHIAIAIDEFGSVVGMVTMEDLLEEVVGEIIDEYDADDMPRYVEVASDEWVLDGRMLIDEVNHDLHVALPEGDWDTVGGLLLDAFERVPQRGESIVIGAYEFIIEHTFGRRIRSVRIKKYRPHTTLQNTETAS